jgi:hypothetical protein
VICPSPAPHAYLIGGHRYLFKEPTGSKAQQIWSEVIAYEISRGLGVIVPPAFIAFDPITNVPGVLVEFFYGYSVWDRPTRFVHAIERFQGMRMPIDLRHGSLHDNMKLTQLHRLPNWKDWWGATIAFDAMIGNTDRHSENWGFLVDLSKLDDTAYSMAPAFDNGTSLGFLIRDADLGRFMKPARFAEFINRGRHHYGWVSGNDGTAGHAALCGQFMRVYGDSSVAIRNTIRLKDSRIEQIMQWCTGFDFPIAFTPSRAEFVAAQLRARRDAIAAAIGV